MNERPSHNFFFPDNTSPKTKAKKGGDEAKWRIRRRIRYVQREGQKTPKAFEQDLTLTSRENVSSSDNAG
jgi:hypothetical protein